MKRTILISTLILGSALFAAGETYKWTDDRGVIHFSDDNSNIPRRYRSRVKTMEDITIRNPSIQQGLKEREEKASKEEKEKQHSEPAPSPPPPPAPSVAPLPTVQPQITQPATSTSDELPPGRTKSQRIRDNIERRKAEEKAQQSGGDQH